jgi:hypothetical protein
VLGGGDLLVEWFPTEKRCGQATFRGTFSAYDIGDHAIRLELSGICESTSRSACERCARTFGAAVGRTVLQRLWHLIEVFG